MNEINFNAFTRSLGGAEKSFKTVANPKDTEQKRASAPQDSVEFSKLPDLLSAEAGLEEEFAAIRSRLEGEVNGPHYPPLETIDRLAEMLALELAPPRAK